MMTRTMREQIFWEYAVLISQQAFNEIRWKFVQDRYNKLRNGTLKISSFTHDTLKMFDYVKACAYCAKTDNLQWDHIMPQSRGGIDSIENMVLACASCNASKGNKHVVDWYSTALPPLVMSKYLKLAYQVHENQGTLEDDCEGLKQLLNLISP